LFFSSVRSGTWKKDGYPKLSYSVSKVGINAVTAIQQREIEKDTSRPGIIVNACCPGYCKTDMTSNQVIGGLLTAEQGFHINQEILQF
jgi:carbonyl reductase 1